MKINLSRELREKCVFFLSPLFLRRWNSYIIKLTGPDVDVDVDGTRRLIARKSTCIHAHTYRYVVVIGRGWGEWKSGVWWNSRKLENSGGLDMTWILVGLLFFYSWIWKVLLGMLLWPMIAPCIQDPIFYFLIQQQKNSKGNRWSIYASDFGPKS